MKRYLLGLFAVVLAVGFSAFTIAEKPSTKTTALYWYNIDGSDFGTLIENQTYERSEVIGGGTHQLTTCENSTSSPCIVGSTSNSEQGNSLPSLDATNAVFQN